jgi:hypothetical protein
MQEALQHREIINIQINLDKVYMEITVTIHYNFALYLIA